MDTVREQLNRPLVVGIVAFVLGLLLGWFALGWGLFPVTWSDAAPEHLRADLQEEYLRMAIDSYAVNPDPALAQARYASLGAGAQAALDAIKGDPQRQPLPAIIGFSTAVGAEARAPVATAAPGTPAAETPAAGAGEQPAVETPAAERPATGGFMRVILPVLCVVLLLLAGALIALFVLRGRQQAGGGAPAHFKPAAQPERQTEWTDYSAIGEETPMSQFMASYKLGDDLFDDSFSIDSPTGEFLGECGVGISEPIGVGDPKRVTAFEVWLFDKNDIQTVTKVLMSQHAFMEESVRQRLAAKGEPVLVEPGTETVLETQSLRLVVRVVDMGYGDGPLPSQSFFDRLILELAVWQKNQPA